MVVINECCGAYLHECLERGVFMGMAWSFVVGLSNANALGNRGGILY